MMVFPFSVICVDKEIETVLCVPINVVGVLMITVPALPKLRDNVEAHQYIIATNRMGSGYVLNLRASMGVDPRIWTWCLCKDQERFVDCGNKLHPIDIEL